MLGALLILQNAGQGRFWLLTDLDALLFHFICNDVFRLGVPLIARSALHGAAFALYTLFMTLPSFNYSHLIARQILENLLP